MRFSHEWWRAVITWGSAWFDSRDLDDIYGPLPAWTRGRAMTCEHGNEPRWCPDCPCDHDGREFAQCARCLQGYGGTKNRYQRSDAWEPPKHFDMGRKGEP